MLSGFINDVFFSKTPSFGSLFLAVMLFDLLPSFLVCVLCKYLFVGCWEAVLAELCKVLGWFDLSNTCILLNLLFIQES